MNAKSVSQVCALILLAANVALAAPVTYYVKNGGLDSESGLSDTKAWATIAKVNTEFANGTFKAGDSILLKCGSMWAEQLVITQSGDTTDGDITIGAYGSGNRPILGYDLKLSGGWSATGGGFDNVYQMTVTPTVYVVDETTTSGTAAGYFRAYSRKSSKQEVEDQVGSYYWVSSILYVHAYDDTDLTTALNKTLYGNTRGHDVGSDSGGNMDFGAIRTNGESYITIQNVHPVNQGYGIGGMNTDHITIDDCRISGTYTATWFGHLLLETTASHDITTKNCEVRFNGNGLRHYNSNDVVVHDNTLSDSWNRVVGEDRTLVAVIGDFARVQIYDNDFSEGRNGIEVDIRANTCEDVYIHHNRFYGDMEHGVAMWGRGKFAGDIHVYHNIIWIPRADFTDIMGISMNPKGLDLAAVTNSSTEPYIVYNNTISAKDGLFMDRKINLVLKNNIFYECLHHINDDAEVVTGDPHTRDYNFYYPLDSTHDVEWAGTGYTTLASYRTASGEEGHGKDLDPDFVNDPPDQDNLRITGNGNTDDAGENPVNNVPYDPSTALDFYGTGIGTTASVGAAEPDPLP